MLYNRSRYIELFKRLKYFENLGKNFYEEEPENFLEFEGYKIYFSEYVCWSKRFKILSLMEKFSNGKIETEEFTDAIFALHREVREETNDKSDELISGFLSLMEKFSNGKIETEDELISGLSSEKFQDFNTYLRVKRWSNLDLLGYLYCLCDYYEDQDPDDYDFQNQEFSETVKDCLLNAQELLKED